MATCASCKGRAKNHNSKLITNILKEAAGEVMLDSENPCFYVAMVLDECNWHQMSDAIVDALVTCIDALPEVDASCDSFGSFCTAQQRCEDNECTICS